MNESANIIPGDRRCAAPLRVEVAGEELYLSSLRAVYWPRERSIMIADVHLGKAESFRVLGAPIPAHQILNDQLTCMSALMKQFECKRVLVLGDLLHAPAGLTPALVAAVAQWVSATGAQIFLVPGNHDRQLTKVASEWELTLLPAVHTMGPFTFVHEPRAIPGGHVWCGHLHPAVRMRSGHDSMKLPAFHIGMNISVLPAFSRFTAGGPITPVHGDRVFAIADGNVVQVL